jgi:hypothetical protein
MKTKLKNKLYLVLTISPCGLSDMDIIFLDEEPDPYHYTRGEGQAMVFELKTWDFSMNFLKAVQDGRFFNDYGKHRYQVEDMDKKNEKIKEAMKNIIKG